MQVVSRLPFVACLIFCAIGLGGCRTLPWKKNEEEPPPSEEPASMKVPVGTVHLVHPEGTFVLIRSTRFLQVEPDTELAAFGADGIETARLRVSPARKGSFVTADILTGTPRVGDQVLMDYLAPTRRSAADLEAERASEVQVLE